ncbi:hypothetical protein T4C_13018 [Trichinella pseudospiralis]|uniref:Uncharacterized protein n=1 Tax=Trichinella pseudospiralis TaxID=6337 RepID=A0A0V1IXP5_TRIPS|nr:hypothetical protein T4C_13018 [Trichinella pseudospiralis]
MPICGGQVSSRLKCDKFLHKNHQGKEAAQWTEENERVAKDLFEYEITFTLINQSINRSFDLSLANLKQQSLAAAIRDIFSFLSSIHSFCLYRFEKYNNLRFNLQFDSKHRNSHY